MGRVTALNEGQEDIPGKAGSGNPDKARQPDPGEIPHLIRLLDDESEAVRAQVRARLLGFGDVLEEAVEALEGHLLPLQLSRVRSILHAAKERRRFHERWKAWTLLADDARQLEEANTLLSEFIYGWRPPVSLPDRLDALTEDYLLTCSPADPATLSRFLFSSKKMRGNIADYYNPMNSNLLYVIEERRGIPISLTCIMILMGARLGLRIEGCNLPGHFLARNWQGGEMVLYDCFNGGRAISGLEIAKLRAQLPVSQSDVLDEPASPVAIMSRMLNNLIRAYELANNEPKRGETRALLAALPEIVSV